MLEGSKQQKFDVVSAKVVLKPFVAKFEHRVSDLEQVFNACFIEREQTCLISGADEPIYLPWSAERAIAEIHSTKDYFASALHEIAHWCIAGAERRKLEDYGYWYEPDGRSEQTQRLFEQVEYQPQALEWIFTRACQAPFRLSVDNVNQPDVGASDNFITTVTAQAKRYIKEGLPARAQCFLDALIAHYQTPSQYFSAESFQEHLLR